MRIILGNIDKPTAAAIARVMLVGPDFCLEEASGEELVRAVKEPPCDALVLELPDSSDMSVVRALRGTTAAPIVVIFSGPTSPHDRAAAHNAGADRCLHKPMGLGELAATLRSLVDLHGRCKDGSGRQAPPEQPRAREEPVQWHSGAPAYAGRSHIANLLAQGISR